MGFVRPSLAPTDTYPPGSTREDKACCMYIMFVAAVSIGSHAVIVEYLGHA